MLLNIRPRSESQGGCDEWLQYLREDCGSVVAAAALQRAISELGDGQYDEWVTATSPRPGVDALQRPTGDPGQRAGGVARMTVRRAIVPSSMTRPTHELLRVSQTTGQPSAAACMIPGPEVVPGALVTDPAATHRPPPQSMHTLFEDAATHRFFILCVEACLGAIIREIDMTRTRGPLAPMWGVLGELLTMAAPAAPQPEVRFSTQWDPLEQRSHRPANPEDLMARGCRCRDMDYRFVEWVLQGCHLGVLRLRVNMASSPEQFVALLRHDALFQLLSRARAHPINPSSVFRGIIDAEDPNTFRVAASLAAPGAANDAGDWYATFKHHLAFVLRTDDLRSGIRDRAAAADLWLQGVVLFILSAPRSRGGRWRITLATPSPITGDCVLVVLSWVGNGFFGHEALRRGTIDARLTGASPEGNVLRGIITDEAVEAYAAAAAVPLDDEQRGVLSELNTSSSSLFCITALAGAGKTVLAHCVVKAFLAAYGGQSPRRLVILTVPTRSLREEVVLDLLKFKASIVSCFPFSNSLACPRVFLVVYINNVSRWSVNMSSFGLGGRLTPRSSSTLTSKSTTRCVVARRRPTQNWSVSSRAWRKS